MLRLTCLLLASGMFMAPAADAPDTDPVHVARLQAERPATDGAGAADEVQLTQNTGTGRRVAAFWFILPNR